METEGYIHMKRRHQEEFDALGGKFFAFNPEQFRLGMSAVGLQAGADNGKIVKFPGGLFVREEAVPELVAWRERIIKELDDAIAADETGREFIYSMFVEELDNHEYQYTRDPYPALDALSLTMDDVNANPPLRAGLELAISNILARRDV